MKQIFINKFLLLFFRQIFILDDVFIENYKGKKSEKYKKQFQFANRINNNICLIRNEKNSTMTNENLV